VIDNIYLRKFDKIKDKTKNQIKLLEKVNNFRIWLLKNKDLNVKILKMDDGVAIIKK
jgi:predicted O-methyltransferase YrrM